MDDVRINNVFSKFEAGGIKCNYFENIKEAKSYIVSMVDKDDTVGFGGSQTIYDMGIHNELIEKGNEIFWHWLEENPEDKKSALLKSRDANIYLTSSNAITEEGEIVNVDGLGNRVSTMVFGPKKTVIVCGINKLCLNLLDALDRNRKKASPLNAQRLNRKTPCSTTGECYDCDSPERICNVTTIIHRKPMGIEMELVLVNEELGF